MIKLPMFKSKTKQRLGCLLLAVLLFLTANTATWAALPPACANEETNRAQLLCAENLYRKYGIEYLEVNECTASGAAAAAPTTPTGTVPTALRDKLALLVFTRANTTAEIASAATSKVGGIFVRPSNANDDTTYSGIRGALTGATPLIAVDFEGGRVQAPGADLVGGAVPSAAELGRKSEAEIQALAKEKGQKLASFGINMDFAPVLDIGGTNQAVIGDRAFGNDAETVTKKAGAFAAGLNEAGIITSLKHFPGHGSRDGDSHTAPVATGPLSELENRDLKPYKALSSGARTTIMMGHLKVPDWGEQVTSLNPAAYQYLRSTMGFQGLVITDALDMGGITGPADQPSRAVAAIQAGADMALLNSVTHVTPTINQLETAVNAGQIPAARVDESAARVVALQAGNNNPQPVAIDPCGPCVGTGGEVPEGSNNQERAFRFFVGKGMAPNQAAGFVGNLMAESGPNIDPTAVNPDSGAYGIAQWLGSRLTGLESYARDKNGQKDNFDIQINYLWDVDIPAQINGGFPDIGKVTQNDPNMTVEQATEIILLEFERPGEGERKLEKRIQWARGVLVLYGNAGPGAANGSGTNEASCGGGAGSVIDGFVLYNQYDPKWKDKPYGVGDSASTIGESGCGPSSVAMVVATLTGDRSVTPETIASKYARFYDPGAGSNWGLFTSAPPDYGLTSEAIGEDMQAAADAIRGGALVIASGTGIEPFTEGGHILVLRGVTDDGKFLVGDSGHTHTNEQEFEAATLAGPIRNMWVIKKG